MDKWEIPSRRQLTGKQWRFALKVGCERMSLSRAYRETYSVNGKPETVHVSASRLAKDPRIAAKIAEYRAAVLAVGLQRREHNRAAATPEDGNAFHSALAKGHVGAALRALTSKAKLAGLLGKR